MIAFSKLSGPLPVKFYNREPQKVGRDLLGKVLVRREGHKVFAARFVEVEAYLGQDDPAAHSASGRTQRNSVLFGPPGRAYVYFIYGNHFCLNVSCLPDGQAGGILFRGAEPLLGIQDMSKHRGIEVKGPRDLCNLTRGPGRLAEAFAITRVRDNDKDLTDPASDLYIAGDDTPPPRVMSTIRIGITKAADLPLRYVVPGNPYVSGPKRLCAP